MSEFEEEVKKAEKELSLMPIDTGSDRPGNAADDEFLGDLKMQAQEYGQKIQDAAVKARDYANEKFTQAGDKFKEARQKPGQTILISAAVGLVLGFLLRRGRK